MPRNWYITSYRRVQCFRGSGDFVHACISVCVSARAIIFMCIRVFVNKERLEQMVVVNMNQLFGKTVRYTKQTSRCVYLSRFWLGSIFRRSKFPFSELKLMWYRLKNISSMICGCRCQLEPTGINYANNSWSYGAPIGVVFLIPINLASGTAVAWCGCAQRGSWSGSHSPSQSTKSYITTTKECISVRKTAIKLSVPEQTLKR